MTKLDQYYARILHVGFIVLRQAVESGVSAWVDAELELLHNVPSLIGESNKARHRYYWSKERTHHIEWVSVPGREEARSRMMTFYAPIWDEMEPLVQQFLEEGSSSPTMGKDATPD